jgi:hypothetical protein
MAALEILLLALFLIFFVLVLIRADRKYQISRTVKPRRRTSTRKEPRL